MFPHFKQITPYGEILQDFLFYPVLFMYVATADVQIVTYYYFVKCLCKIHSPSYLVKTVQQRDSYCGSCR
jgi:hypothetical protein